MAGISVSLEGDNIQLAFEKGDQATAVVMDAEAARSLTRALHQLLVSLGEAGDDDELGDMVDITSPSVEIGLDDNGQAVIALQAGEMPPFMLRLKDDEARHIAEGLLEILRSPRDVRTSLGGH
jgi:hypothetical protein